MASVPSSKYLPAEERRAETVQAVLDLAAEQDPGQITTAAIAKQMGLTQGSLFRHFVNKEAIVEAVILWVSDFMQSRLSRVVSEHASPLDALRAIFLGHIDMVAQRQGLPRLLISELQRSGDTAAKKLVMALMNRYLQHIATLIGQAKEQGLVDEGIDTTLAAQVYLGTVQGLVLQSLLTRNVDAMKRNAPKAYAFFIRGMGGRTGDGCD